MSHNEIDTNINLLHHSDNVKPKGKKIFKLSKFIVYIFTILLITFFIFTFQVLFTDNSFLNAIGGNGSFFKQLTTLATGGGDDLKGMSDDRINILLLGMGGIGHDGPNLTDTIIVASIQPSTKKISMISIPRDLLVEIPDNGKWKINNANHFGEKIKKGEGGELSSETVGKVLDIPIHYYIRVDFTGFEKLIDDLGGVKVFVDNSFVDSQFPTYDYKYQVVAFEEGWQTMDGNTALQFVRSRHGNNGEGSDFARSARQQKVIVATKDRILSYKTFFNPNKFNKLLKTFGDHMKTNLSMSNILELYKMSKSIDLNSAKHVLLDDSPNGYLYPSFYNEAYVLQPKDGDYSTIRFMAENIFADHEIAPPKKTKTANLEIMNGTETSGLAFRTSEKLKTLGFKVVKIGNAPEQDYIKTIIYDLTEDKDPNDLEVLKRIIPATIETEIPEWISDNAELTTDYFLMLGESAVPVIE